MPRDVERVIEIPSAVRDPYRVRLLRNAVDSDALIIFEVDECEADLTLFRPFDPAGDGTSRMCMSISGDMPVEVIAYALRAAGYQVTDGEAVRTPGDALRKLQLPEWAEEHDRAPARSSTRAEDDEDEDEEDPCEDENEHPDDDGDDEDQD